MAHDILKIASTRCCNISLNLGILIKYTMAKIYDICAFILTLGVLCFSCCISSKHWNEFSDQSALLSLKDSITEDPYGILTHNWTANTSVCNWFGVYCGVLHRRVTALDLGGMGLVGMITPEIGNLSFLSFLNISDNKFHGSLPFELGHLHRLKVMNMRANDISGEIPSSLGMLQGLQHLDVGHNSLTGKIPLSIFNISSLQFINLSFNNLTGSLPNNLCNRLASVTEIRLSFNYVTGKIPFNIGNCGNLQLLSMGNNSLTGSIPKSIAKLPLLEELYLQGNQLTGNIPSSLFNVSSLWMISLWGNMLAGKLPSDLCDNLPEIETIAVSYNKLSGPIPSNLSTCRKLQMLSLSFNAFSGQIPEGVGMLPLIQELFLGDNYLTGTIPGSISNLTSLKKIALERANLSGKLPRDVSSLSLLTVFHAGGNNFDGNIWESFCNLSRLKGIYLFSNHLHGSIPQCLGYLQSLKTVALKDNYLTGSIPHSVFNISMLEELYLEFNSLSGQLPVHFGDLLPNIQYLVLGSNNLTGSIPTSISNATKLCVLSIENNQLVGFIPATLGKLHELESLSLHTNHLTAQSTTTGANLLRSLTDCRRLRSLLLGYNPLKLELPSSLGNLSGSLDDFDLSSSEIHGSIPNTVGNLTSLRKLSFWDNNLTGPVPGTLGRLPKIQRLYLHDNKLHGPIPISLCQARNMGDLFLSGNRISGSIPSCLGNMTSLRILLLDNNQLSSSIPVELCNLRDLLYLDIAFNNLQGFVPLGIGNFKVADIIDLSNNQLLGAIPSTIGGLQELSNFSLSGNRLWGSIPAAFGRLRSLQSLDLSRNELSGGIPGELEGLSYLEYFNVSFNRLEGKIPSGGPFANFTAASFMGNPGLCGSPRLEVPPCPKFSERKHKQSWILKIILPVLASGLLLLILTFFMMRRNKKKSNISVQDGSHMIKNMRRISYFELLAATNQFGESNLIGAGAFGLVYRAVLSDGIEVAVKVFNMQIREAFRNFDAECEILKNIRHRNLVQIISNCSNPDFKALVFKYMQNGSLHKWLHASDHHHLSFNQRLSIMIDVACAIEYLHHGYSVPVIHRDLKPSNVLLDEDMVAHVSDFGLARLLNQDQSTILSENLATIGYMAPEYGLGGLVSTKADVYSYGILLMETFSGKEPTDSMFEADMSLKQWIQDVCCGSGSLINVIDPKLLNEDGGDWPSKEQCISWVMELALSCVAEVPYDRNNMIEVAARLKNIRKQFLASTKRGGVWRR